MVNFTRAVLDDAVEVNADFQARAGLDVKIVRTPMGRVTCDWCKRLVGTYDYEDVRHGHDVWKRHLDCDCKIEHVSEKGRKVVRNYKRSNREQIEARKQLEAPNDRAPEMIEARKQVVGVDAKSLEGKEEKKLSELGKFSKKYRNDGRMGEKYYKAVRKKFSNGSEIAKKLSTNLFRKILLHLIKLLMALIMKMGKCI